VLSVEGRKNNIKVNTIAPVAATRMTEDVMSAEALQRIKPERVTPGVLYLCSEQAPSKVILGAGGGTFSTATIMETAPVHLTDDELTPEGVAARFPQISDWKTARAYAEVLEQVQVFLAPAA
jgi:NAD(P)-dependent dehydrogenase (short-subunit alcohol dehydrogenase family)